MNALVRPRLVSTITAAVVFLSACSNSTPPVTDDAADASKKQVPTEPVSAKTALWPMYTSARAWATDFVLLKMDSKELTGYKNEAGKAAIWEATFASPSKKEYRIYTYAIAAQKPDIYKGVVVGRGMPWSGATRDAMPIQISEFSIDSDSAFKTASEAAADWLKKNPGKPITSFELWNNYKSQVPVWTLMWGDKKAGYRAFVHATDGKLVKN